MARQKATSLIDDGGHHSYRRRRLEEKGSTAVEPVRKAAHNGFYWALTDN